MEPSEKIVEKNPNKKPPVIVNYCPKCGLPTEYCEFDEKCSNPNAVSQTNEEKTNKPNLKTEKISENNAEETKEKEEPKPKKKVAVKEDKIVISKQTRSKKKFITSISGLDKFNVNVKDCAKKMGKKFACGSSAISEDTIEIQGDIMEELMEFILKEFPHINEKQIIIKEKK